MVFGPGSKDHKSMNFLCFPSAADKRAAQCYKLQERFLLIQAGIQDERDELLEEIGMLETDCEETKTMPTLIGNNKCTGVIHQGLNRGIHRDLMESWTFEFSGHFN